MSTATMSDWIAGSRPRTLPAAIAPVVVGACAAVALGGFDPWYSLLALIVGLALQVGVNFANDYSDGIRGTDAQRVGPTRLVASGLAAPRTVRNAAFASFGVAVVAGLILVAISGHWWLLVVGSLAIAAAWFYTGGKRPYGYRGLGEVMVFIFFGLVPVLATTYVQSGRVDGPTVAMAVAIGLLASALLVANNLRDIPTDRQVGKLTLAVRLGDDRTRILYAGMIGGAIALVIPVAWRYPWAWLALGSIPFALGPLQRVLAGCTGRDLIPVLAGTGRLELVYAILLGAGLLLSV